MLVGRYIFVIFLSLCVIRNYNGTCSFMGHSNVKSPKGLNPTLSGFNEIWHTRWFQPPNLKSNIFQWSDDRFLRYWGLIFWKFWENKGGRPTSKHHIFWTSGPIWKSYGIFETRKNPGILIWHHFCDLGKFWGDDLLTLILTPWIKFKILITIWYRSPICYLQHIKRWNT